MTQPPSQGADAQAASPEFARLVLEMASMLNGLTVAEAQFALHQVGQIVSASARFDKDGPDFRRQLDMADQYYGESAAPARRQ